MTNFYHDAPQTFPVGMVPILKEGRESGEGEGGGSLNGAGMAKEQGG